ncbi:MAG TPA: hypothetical protein VFC63_22720 [Blastocatellia bacterium]|nr:hypothetical protein [Blastocatellia bacterium]
MGIFDLVLILTFLFTVISLLRFLYLLIRGRRVKAFGTVKHLAIFLATYFAVLVVVSLASPQRVLPMGQDECFDDWCVSVDNAKTVSNIGSGSTAATANGNFYVLQLKVSSRARRISQRAPDGVVYILDGKGNRYEVSEAGQRAYEAANGATLPIDSLLGPSSSFTTVRVFDLPKDVTDPGLVVQHGIGPGRFVIGDSSSFFHKRTVISLKSQS